MSDERTVAQVVNQIPENWCWCLEQPSQWNKGGQGKKKKRYTAYVSNEYYIGDWRFESIHVHDNDPVHALQSAYDKVLTLVAKRKAREKKKGK